MRISLKFIMSKLGKKYHRIIMAISDNIYFFIPIFIITLFVLAPNETIVGAHSILGKLCIVLLVVFYAWKSILYGVLISLLIIVFYQMNTYETMLDVSSIMGESVPLSDSHDEKSDESIYNSQSSFQQKYCIKDELTFKGMNVKPEMTEHIFPEISFNNNHKCNVCDSTCHYRILKTPEEEVSYRQEFG